jgi:hypothetical protein
LRIESVSPDEVRISWSPVDGTGWFLQEASALTPANWSVSSTGVTNPVIISTGGFAKLFRLFKP